MSASSSSLRRCRAGSVAVEFAVSLPFLLALLVGIVEVGRALIQAGAIEKGLRAGAMYVARADLPLDAAATTAIENLVKRGSVDPAAPFLVDGWSEAEATVDVAPLPDYVVDGVAVPVFRLTATVPFAPLMPGLLGFTVTRSHEQAYVGR